MSVLSFFGFSQLSPAPSDDFWYGPVSTQTAAGIRVDDAVAMTYSACWAARMLLATTGGMIPLKLFSKLGGGGSTELRDDPRYAMVHDAPNDEMTSMMFRCNGIGQQVDLGNSYSEIERNRAGVAIKLHPIHASRIPANNVLRGSDGRLFYRVKNKDGTTTDIKSENMLHVPSPISDDGIIGRGVVENARLTIGFGIATETQGAAYMSNSARPALVIEQGEAKRFKDLAEQQEFRRQWNEIHGGPANNAKPAVLPPGTKANAIQWNANDSQFLETRQHNIEEIARWYGVPPHLIGHLLRSTNNNIVQQSLEFVKFSLMRWLVLWEQELNRKLLTPEDRKTKFFKHIVEGLERADITTRTAALHQQWFDGLRTINEWRAIEDLNPIGPVGDVHFTQQAMIPLEIAAKGPQEKPAPEPESESDDSGDLRAEFQAGIESLRAEIPHGLNGEAAELREQLAASRAVQQRLAKAMFRDVMSRLLSVEINGVKRVAEKPERFSQRLKEFYDRHAVTMGRALDDPADACRECGLSVPEDIATTHVAESLKQLDALLDCTADELAGKVESCVSKWHEERVVTL